MAKITETELRRKLKKAATTGTGGAGVAGPTAIKVGATWEYATPVLYLSYATSITNATAGVISNQSDATGFQIDPFNSAGSLLTWRGSMLSKSIYQSGDATDYTWEDITVYSGSVSFVRYYTESSEIESNIGNPDTPGSGIIWTSIASSSPIPSTAFWVAEQYTMNSIESTWNIKQYKIKSAGFGIITWTKSPVTVMPTLNSTQWNNDTLLATGAFTGETYSNIIELGYGTAVTITYSDGKLSGLLKDVSGTATWAAPTDFIDGDLVVDGTVVASKLSVNELSAISADIGVLTSGSSTNGAVVRNSKGTGIYDTGDNLVMATGDLTYWTTTNSGAGVLKFPPATP